MKAKSPGTAAPSAAGGSPKAASAAKPAAQQQQQPAPQKEQKRASKSDMMAVGSFVLVAVIAIIAGKYSAQTTGVFQNTKGLVATMLGRSLEAQQAAAQQKQQQAQAEAQPEKKAFKLGVEVEPFPKASIATPTASLREAPMLSPEEIKQAAFRPHVLTDSINPPVTPAHGAETLGLFLYRNGFSDQPTEVLIAREQFCRSATTMSEGLSVRVGAEYNCQEGCRIFLHNGWEVTSCDELVDDDKIWLVPRGREFMWPTFKRGHKVEVRHVDTVNKEPIVVETLSESPKVFRLNNFFTTDEADELIAHTLGMNDPVHGLHRSTTGQGAAAQEDSHRTSENAWDLVSAPSMRLKRRIFELLGIRPFQNGWADGLQVLRYNRTKAYNSHYDYLEYTPGSRLDSSVPGGANRFATVVIYLTDVEEGGETVFPNGAALDGSDKSYAEVMNELEGNGIKLRDMGIKQGSWEERLVVQCRSKLAVRPKKAEAVLFYDQLPMGGQDDASLHGGCPVLKGTKWAANLWVWNGNVHGDDFAAQAPKKQDETQLQAEFVSRVAGHSLYWQDTYFSELHVGQPVRMNTFEGHVFHVHEGRDEASKGKRVATFTMGRNTGRLQSYVYPPEEQPPVQKQQQHFEAEEEGAEWSDEEDSDEEEYFYEDEF